MPDPEPEPNAAHRRPGRLIWVIVALALAAGAALAYRPLRYHLGHVVTDDAYVGGALVAISPSVAGRLAVLSVAEGDTVIKGQRIAQLKDDTYRAIAAQVEASVARARSQLVEAEIILDRERRRAGPLALRDEADLTASKARLSASEAALNQAETELQRVLRLSESGLTSTADLDVSLTLRRTRQAELDAAREEVHKAQAVRELTNGHSDAVRIQLQRVETARAELRLTESELDAANIRLENTRLYSPVHGIVARVTANQGELLEENQTVALIHDMDALWVVANVEETEIRNVRPGQPVSVTVDAHPGRSFDGRVLHIGSTTTSQFALIPRQSVSGNFVKVIQRVPVRISVSDPDGILKLGLSAIAAIDIWSPEPPRAR